MTKDELKYIDGQIFQLTSSRGGWLLDYCIFFRFRYFNSHPHEEDDCRYIELDTSLIISTHILTRRMTLHGITVCLLRNHFNSHPHEEDDGRYSARWPNDNISTHILTRRMTQCVKHFFTAQLFQLTSSRGGWRSTSLWTFSIREISTHILTRRMTQLDDTSKATLEFQLTSSRGGWRLGIVRNPMLK